MVKFFYVFMLEFGDWIKWLNFFFFLLVIGLRIVRFWDCWERRVWFFSEFLVLFIVFFLSIVVFWRLNIEFRREICLWFWFCVLFFLILSYFCYLGVSIVIVWLLILDFINMMYIIYFLLLSLKDIYIFWYVYFDFF